LKDRALILRTPSWGMNFPHILNWICWICGIPASSSPPTGLTRHAPSSPGPSPRNFSINPKPSSRTSSRPSVQNAAPLTRCLKVSIHSTPGDATHAENSGPNRLELRAPPSMSIRKIQNHELSGKNPLQKRKEPPGNRAAPSSGRIVPTEAKPSELSGCIVGAGAKRVKEKSSKK